MSKASPRIAPDNSSDSTPVHPKMRRDNPRWDRTANQAYFIDLIKSKHRARMPLPGKRTTLVLHVPGVISRGSGEYMKWIAARRIVARMAGKEPIAKGSVGQCAYNSVRAKTYKFTGIIPVRYDSVLASRMPDPRPAFPRTTNVNIRPKTIEHALRYVILGKILRLHELASLSGWGLSHSGGAPTSPGFSL